MKLLAGTAPYRRDATPRLAAWLVVVVILIALAYGSRAADGKPSPQVLYEWSTAIGGLVQDAVLLAIMLAIAGFDPQLLAWRRPESWRRALALVGGAVVGIYAVELVYSVIFHPGNEQGLTPAHWEPSHAAAYVANGIVICLWVPFVEETIYRGLGYSLLLAPLGRLPTILAVGTLFGLSHGLLVTLPLLVVFGSALAYVRARTESAFPGMLAHGTFNLLALIAAVI